MNTKAKQHGKKMRKAVMRLDKSGLTQAEIGAKLGISKQRVWQILSPNWAAYLADPSSKAAKLERARKRYAARREAGLTREEIVKPKEKASGPVRTDAL